MATFQAGITNRPPEHARWVALNIVPTDPAAIRGALEALRDLIRQDLRSELDDTTPQSPKDRPSAETGELGFDEGYDRYHLTITVGFAKSAYEKLGVPADTQPQDLIPIPWAQLGDGPSIADNGDVVLQICSDSVYLVEHVQRHIESDLAHLFTVAWAVAGTQRYNSRPGRVSREEGRALIGFIDGTTNLNPRRNPDDAHLVFVNPKRMDDYPPRVPAIAPGQPNPYGGPQLPNFPGDLREPPTREPEWTRHGTYLVVRASTIQTTTWDQTALGEQERIVGRWKVSGSALDKPDDPTVEPAEPDFTADPNGAITPVNSHARKTNPRGGDEDLRRRLFRRGYPLIAAGPEGTRRGLIFAAFGRTLTTQFEFMTRAWTINQDFPFPGAGVDALRRFESQVLCGGYFFVPPLERSNQPWSWSVPPFA